MAAELEKDHPESIPETGEIKLSEDISGVVHKILNLSYEEMRIKRDMLIRKYGEEQYAEFLEKKVWDTKILIDFPDFLNTSNNFHLFFIRNYMGEMYRSQDFYKKFARENPELASSLLVECNSGKEKIDMQKIYEVYKIMLSYEEVKSNRELFQ